jgi:hypothetical protein
MINYRSRRYMQARHFELGAQQANRLLGNECCMALYHMGQKVAQLSCAMRIGRRLDTLNDHSLRVALVA